MPVPCQAQKPAPLGAGFFIFIPSFPRTSFAIFVHMDKNGKRGLLFTK